MSSRRSHSYDFEFSGTGASAAVAIPTKNPYYATQGVVRGVQVMLLTGASVTGVTPYILRGNVTDGTTLPADSERIYEGATVASPTASTTDQIAQDNFDPRPFGEGCTPVLDIDGSGSWTARMTVHVELDG